MQGNILTGPTVAQITRPPDGMGNGNAKWLGRRALPQVTQVDPLGEWSLDLMLHLNNLGKLLGRLHHRHRSGLHSWGVGPYLILHRLQLQLVVCIAWNVRLRIAKWFGKACD